jgi:hypothetical protein
VPKSYQQIISIIGSQYGQPIADLIGSLIARPKEPSDRISSNHVEGGYAAAIILLLAAHVESFVQRDRYFYVKRKPSRKVGQSVAPYLKTTLKYRRWNHIEELFEVRNAIAHNHIWEIEFETPNSGGRRHKSSIIVPWTHRLKVAPNQASKIHRTKRLQLHLLPSLLDRLDVYRALQASSRSIDEHDCTHQWEKTPIPRAIDPGESCAVTSR